MTTLGIDLETYSELDIKKVGGYKYSENCEILLFGFAFDNDPVTVLDLLSGESIPLDVKKAIHDTQVRKTAYNAQFERTVLSEYFTGENYMDGDSSRIQLDPKNWFCTMVHGLYCGMPGNLGQLSEVLFPSKDRQKMSEGKDLIRYFCGPCKPTKVNGGRTRNLPEHAPGKWELFKQYCARDVSVERDARLLLEKIPFPAYEHKLYCIDQRINDRGVKLDMDLVRKAMDIDKENKAAMEADAKAITGLANVNSGAQMKDWLEKRLWSVGERVVAPPDFVEGEETHIPIESLDKERVKKLLEEVKDPMTKEVLLLRQQLSKTSVKKYQAMDVAICRDGRVRGLLQFYGANRTGRWAGRLVQVQNLPKNYMEDLDLARTLVKEFGYETIDLLFPSTQNVLSQLIRTAFVAEDQKRFIISDFSAIEARVIAWLAGEKWRMEVFRTHGKIYEASASAMFHVPFESIDKHNPLRQKGKVSELALGYQGGPNALITMGALEMGLTEEELPEIVKLWRAASPAIVKLWYAVESAAKEAVLNKSTVKLGDYLTFSCTYGILFITLPSGRKLCYVKPRAEEKQTKVGLKVQLSYEGMDQTTKQWCRTATYGGKLVENIVQAIARDCLAVSLDRLDQAGYETVLHVHDEICAEEYEGQGSLEEMNEILGTAIDWAPGLLLKGDGFETKYYKKDDQ